MLCASQKALFPFERTPSGSYFRCLHASEASSGIYSWQLVSLRRAHHTGLLSQHPKRQLSPQWRYHHSHRAAVGEWVGFVLANTRKQLFTLREIFSCCRIILFICFQSFATCICFIDGTQTHHNTNSSEVGQRDKNNQSLSETLLCSTVCSCSSRFVWLWWGSLFIAFENTLSDITGLLCRLQIWCCIKSGHTINLAS